MELELASLPILGGYRAEVSEECWGREGSGGSRPALLPKRAGLPALVTLAACPCPQPAPWAPSPCWALTLLPTVPTGAASRVSGGTWVPSKRQLWTRQNTPPVQPPGPRPRAAAQQGMEGHPLLQDTRGHKNQLPAETACKRYPTFMSSFITGQISHGQCHQLLSGSGHPHGTCELDRMRGL